MKLQTQLHLKPQDEAFQINYNSQLLFLGSCFSENIAAQCAYFQLQHLSNPFGIFFHPQAIENFINKCINGFEYTEASIFYHNEQWHCFDAHSKLSSPDKTLLLNRLNRAMVKTKQQLKEATHIVITLGTAWVYEHTNAGIVSNCHKVPQNEFNKRILTINEITNSISTIIDTVKAFNKEVSIIFTISPVRHLKDGFVGNQRSKAHLVTALHNVLQTYHSLQCFYFESYELMLDELREYRFYKTDMLHLNDLSISYIWSKFCLVWINSSAHITMKKVETIQRELQHKPFNTQSKAYQDFKINTIRKIEQLKLEYPHFSF